MNPGTRRRRTLAAVSVSAALVLAGCAGTPVPPPVVEATGAALLPAVQPQQAEQVRAEVAGRLQAALVAGDADEVAAAATGPAAELALLRAERDRPLAGAEVPEPSPAAVLVAPQLQGWPRWFVAVTAADAGELPGLEVYASDHVREPYRLWGRLTMLPGAELPAFPAPGVGAESLADGTGPAAAPGEPSDSASAEGSDEGADGGSDDDVHSDADDDAAELQGVLDGLATRYAGVLTEGDASPSAAEFAPDAFVEAVRARAEAEREAVAGVAGTTVEHSAYRDGDVMYAARAADGDVLAITAVETTTTTTVRPGAGVVRPDADVGAVAGIDETDDTLTTRSVAALAFVVPAEQGAIQLVAVGEGLAGADAP